MSADRCGLTKEQEQKMKATCALLHQMENELYESEFCCARMWNGGFGGQCRRSVVQGPTDEMKEDLPWNAFLDNTSGEGGLCRRHFTTMKKKGELPHGLFSLVPPKGHAWKWLSPGSEDRFGYVSKEDAIQWVSEAKEDNIPNDGSE